MRKSRSVHTLMIAAALMGAVVVSSPARAATATDQDRHPRTTAEEVCEPMVRDAVIAAAGRPLSSPRRGVWEGTTRDSCTYSFGTRGSVVVTVDIFPSHAAARRAFSKQRVAVPRRVTLFGIGQRAFRDGQTRIVAQKDRFLLTVDGSTLARAVHPSSTTWSTTRAIFDCW